MARAEMRAHLAHIIPDRMRRLPVDERGYPVPWFVAWIDGRPDHRIMDTPKWYVAMRKRRCWLCGGQLGKFATFVLGPMCMVNRTSAEPPCHLDCAKFAVQGCPFLSLPRAQYRSANLPANASANRDMLTHNPGAMVLWTCEHWRQFDSLDDKDHHQLVTFGDPAGVQCWTQGRRATRGEMLDAIARGLPKLQAIAEAEGADAPRRLARMVDEAMFWLPDSA